jgi:hypothetical protein
MNKFAMMAAVAVAALMAAPTAAHADWYAGAGYTQYEFDDGDVGGITGRLGYRFNPNFAVEGEGSFGVEDDDAVELSHAVGAYGVASLPITSQLAVHGRLGYQMVEVDTPLGDADDDGIGYGGGVSWNFTNGFGVRADYTRLEGDEGEADTWSLSGIVNF